MTAEASLAFGSELLQIPSPEPAFSAVRRRALLLEEERYDIAMIGQHRFIPGNPSAVFTMLSAIAAITERIRLGSGVLVLPAYHPLDVAEQVATLDEVSGGRAFLGVGVGYRPHEPAAIGRDFQRRGQLMEEALQVLRAVWTSEIASFHGEHFWFDDLTIVPRPLQRPGPPVVVGAMAAKAAERAGRLADVWLGGLMESLDEIEPVIDAYRRAAAMSGNTSRVWLKRSLGIAATRAELEGTWLPGYLAHRHAAQTRGSVWAGSSVDAGGDLTVAGVARDRALVGTPEDIIEEIHRCRARTGCEAIIVNMNAFAGDIPAIERQLRLFAREVMPAFR
jgi:probable F420-dependent oxidoreductase